MQVGAFLAAHGWRPADARPLAGDASFRKYLRLAGDGRRAVLMDAPPEHEDVRHYVRIARHLRALGVSAPEVLAADEDAGLLLLEDFGDATFTRVLAAGGEEDSLYALAVDVLAHIHRLAPARAIPPRLPAYDERRLLDEAFLLSDWYLPAVLGRPTTSSARTTYAEAWREVLSGVRALPTTLVLRDYHVDNLMHLDGRTGIAACGVLDFQDAVVGPPAYDLMSLLEDARRDISVGLRERMLRRYREGAEPADWAAFQTAFVVLAAQRHAKVIGIFTRLSRRDAKHAYLVHIPRVWRLLERCLDHPALGPVARWFDRHVARDARIVPQLGAAAQ